MESISLSCAGHRDPIYLQNKTKYLRISRFNSPSSFYIQLVEEDVFYTELEKEMQRFYQFAPLYRYCDEVKDFKIHPNDEMLFKKLTLQNLQVSFHEMYILKKYKIFFGN